MMTGRTKSYTFLWVFLAGSLLFLAGFLMENYGGLDFMRVPTFLVGSCLVPVTVLLFFREMDQSRDISTAVVSALFLTGGVLSIAISLFLFYVDTIQNETAYFVVLAIVEETAKLLVACCLVAGRDKKHILNGMLVGAAVGAGFAAVETAWYAMYLYGWSYEVLLFRAGLAFGCQTGWAALSGGGLVWAKGENGLKSKHFLSWKFLGSFLGVIALHAAWDLSPDLWLNLGLCILTMVLCLCMTREGRRQMQEPMVHGQGATREGGRQTQTPVKPMVRGQGMTRDGSGQAQPPVMPVVRVQGMNGVYANRRFALNGRMTFGRASGNSLVFPQDTPGVSARHCELFIHNGRVYLRDLRSTYGTYINGRKIEPEQSVELAAGAIVSVGPGREIFRVEIR